MPEWSNPISLGTCGRAFIACTQRRWRSGKSAAHVEWARMTRGSALSRITWMLSLLGTTLLLSSGWARVMTITGGPESRPETVQKFPCVFPRKCRFGIGTPTVPRSPPTRPAAKADLSGWVFRRLEASLLLDGAELYT